VCHLHLSHQSFSTNQGAAFYPREDRVDGAAQLEGCLLSIDQMRILGQFVES